MNIFQIANLKNFINEYISDCKSEKLNFFTNINKYTK